MCLGIPMQLLEIDGIAGKATGPEGIEWIDISLCADAVPGDWVLNFLGAARAIICAEEAANITAALEGLRALMQGGDLGTAFADLEARSPSLPPHLQAALDAGLAQG
jgi:hydrogenase expression/formation protein HypC